MRLGRRGAPLFPLLLLLLIIPFAHSATEQQAWQASNDALYPQGVRELFKGTWIINETRYVYPDAQWSFHKNTGIILFHLGTVRERNDSSLVISDPSRPSIPPEEGWKLAQGFLEYRDGVYSTDAAMKFRLLGLYQWSTGRAVTIGIPFDYVTDYQEKVEEALTQNETARSRFFHHGDLSIVTGEEEPPPCFILARLQINELSTEEVKIMNNRAKDFDPRRRQEDDPVVTIAFDILSTTCKFQIQGEASSIMLQEYYDKALRYAAIVALSSLAQLGLLMQQLKRSASTAAAAKVSMFCIGTLATLDCFFSLFHLSIGVLFDAIMSAFFTVSLFKFIAFSVFYMRLLILTWKARRGVTSSAHHWELARRQISQMYTYLYLGLVGLLMIAYLYPQYMPLHIFVVYSFWVPQIFCNVTRECRFTFSRPFVIGMSLSSLFVPVYFYGCTHNFLHVEPHLRFVWLLVAWQAVQVTVLFMQDRRGARFFIPQQLLPHKYDYFRPVQLSEPEDCVICWNVVDTSTGNHMITPCGHLFHPDCLEQWLEVKMACPTCRQALPVP